MTVVQQQPQPAPNSTNGGTPGQPAGAPQNHSTNVTTSSSAQPLTSPSCSTASTNGHGGMPASTSTASTSTPAGPVKCQPPSKVTPKPGTAVFSHPLSPNHSSGSDTDPVLTTAAAAATALRRLYFKSGRSCRPKGPTVPMVG